MNFLSRQVARDRVFSAQKIPVYLILSQFSNFIDLIIMLGLLKK